MDSDPLVEAFCREHWPRLHGLTVRSVGSWTEAEDVVQELFLGLIRNGRIAGLASRTASEQAVYLSLRLKGLLWKRWRNARRTRRLVMMDAVPLNESHADKASTVMPPSSEADRAWLARCIETAMDRLRQQTQEADWNQISSRLKGEGGTSGQTGAQRVALHRSRQKLRELIREEMNGAFQDWNLS